MKQTVCVAVALAVASLAWGQTGDRNGDGLVDQWDLDIVLGSWGASFPSDLRADPSGDNFVGYADLDTVLGNWGGVIGPEPTVGISVSVVPVDNSSASELAGYVTQDLVVTTDTDWMSAQMIVTLDAPGGFYQDALGSGNPHHPAVIPWPPLDSSVWYDTHVSNGVIGESVSVMGAVDLGGPPVPIFDADHASIHWFTTDADDIGTLALARLSIADTANGTWQFIATSSPAGGPMVQIGGPVIDGVLVPEPATFGICAIYALVCLRRRPKSRSRCTSGSGLMRRKRK